MKSEEIGKSSEAPAQGKEAQPGPRRRAGWKKKVLWSGGLILLSLAILASGLFLLLRSPWFSQQAIRLATEAFNQRFPATLKIRKGILRPFEGFLRLTDVTLLLDQETEKQPAPLEVAALDIRYDPQALLEKRFAIEEVYLFRPHVRLNIAANGRLNLGELILALRRELLRGDDEIQVTLERIRLVEGKVSFWDHQRDISGEMEEIDFRGHLQIKEKSLRGTLRARRTMLRSGKWAPRIDHVTAKFSWEGSELAFDPLELRSEGMHAEIEGKLENLDTQPTVEALFFSQATAEALERLFPIEELHIEGPLRLRGRLSGPLLSPDAEVEVAGPKNDSAPGT